jgi:hypothetical protein
MQGVRVAFHIASFALPPIHLAPTLHRSLSRSWLNLQLSYTEACPERLRWLSPQEMRAPARPPCAARSWRGRQQPGPPLGPETRGVDGPSGAGPISYAEAARHLLAGLLALQLPGAAEPDAAPDCGGSPPDFEDMLAWCRGEAGRAKAATDDGAAFAAAALGGGTGGWVWGGAGRQQGGGAAGALDELAGCLHGLLSLADQARAAGRGADADVLLGAFREVRGGVGPRAGHGRGCHRWGGSCPDAPTAADSMQPPPPQAPEPAARRLLCLLAGRARGVAPSAAAALAARHGRVLVAALEAGGGGGGGALRGGLCAELRHLLPTPQVGWGCAEADWATAAPVQQQSPPTP